MKPMTAPAPKKVKKGPKIQQAHAHLLLWNLRAARDNAKYAPEGSGWRTEAPGQIRTYEAELVRRNIPVPAADTTEAAWEVLLAAALRPHDR